jgi:hypothetical protein
VTKSPNRKKVPCSQGSDLSDAANPSTHFPSQPSKPNKASRSRSSSAQQRIGAAIPKESGAAAIGNELVKGRFEQLRIMLHFNNNEDINGVEADSLQKIRLLLNIMKKKNQDMQN